MTAPPTDDRTGDRTDDRTDDPADDPRLEELRSFAVLDTPAEPGFDDLTELAAHLCEAPIALISLVAAERQWFKSAVGLDVPGTGIEDSFCRYALDGSNLGETGVLEVPDATLDHRFASNPLVTGPEQVRFYAGAPLTTAAGHTLGTLCVLDTRPRELTPQQRRHLLLLARQVLAQLEMRRYARIAQQRSSEQAEARASLERSRRLLDGVLAASQAVIYAKDLDGRFLLANPALHELLGRPAGSLPGMSNWDVFPALAADQFHHNDRDVVASGTATSFTELLTHPDGQVHEYLTTKFPLHSEDGAVYAVGGVSTDVTALAQHRRQLAESLHRWRALVERSPVPLAVIAVDGRFAYANPPAQALYEQALPGDVIGRPAGDYFPPAAEAAARELFYRVLRGASVAGQPWQLQRADGSLIDVEINAVAIEYDGAPAVQVELRDITARAAAEAELRASEARWRAVFDASPVGIALSDSDGRFVAANRALCTLLGRDESDILGHSSAEFTHPDDLPMHRAAGSLIGASPHGFIRIEKRYIRPDGTVRWAWLTVTHTPGPQGQTWTLAHVQDVTDRIGAEQAVRDSEANLTAVAAVVRDIQSGADARHTIVQSGLALAEAGTVSLAEPNADRTELTVTASTLKQLTGTSVSLSAAAAPVEVYTSGQPLFVPDAEAHPHVTPALMKLTAAQSLYLVPVRAGSDTLGVLIVAWDRLVSTLEDRRVSAVTLLADQAGVALRQASLLRELSDLALTDSLTGLPNRRAWNQRLDRMLTRARRTGQPLTIALVDLDHFKRFNDTYGHPAGDALLTDFAAAANAAVRDDDTVARWGGEEFAIALPACSSAAASAVLNKLRGVVPRGQTISVGYATFDGAEAAAELTARADRALYLAKTNGRDQVCGSPAAADVRQTVTGSVDGAD